MLLYVIITYVNTKPLITEIRIILSSVIILLTCAPIHKNEEQKITNYSKTWL
jgi:hypothetical protein